MRVDDVDRERWRLELGEHALALPLRWSSPVQAPQLAATGSWDEVA